MSQSFKLVFLFLTFSGTLASNSRGNVTISNIIDPGFGSNGTGGTTTVMGKNYGLIKPGFAQNIFGVNKTGSDDSKENSSNNGGNFGYFISGIPNKISPNKTDNNGLHGYGIIPGIPNIFINKTPDSTTNKTNSENCCGAGLFDFSSHLTGVKKKNKTSSSSSGESNGGIPFIGYRPPFPDIIFGAHKNTTNNSNPLTGINLSSITDIPEKVLGNNKENKTVEKRHCHSNTNKSKKGHGETSERHKRQTGGLESLGSLVPGGSNLASIGSALGSGDSGDATLILGMFQVLVKPIKTPSINQVTDIIKNPQSAVTDIIKNPQNILTQPQILLNGGKR